MSKELVVEDGGVVLQLHQVNGHRRHLRYLYGGSGGRVVGSFG